MYVGGRPRAEKQRTVKYEHVRCLPLGFWSNNEQRFFGRTTNIIFFLKQRTGVFGETRTITNPISKMFLFEETFISKLFVSNFLVNFKTNGQKSDKKGLKNTIFWIF